jgi:NAD(P)-dependent dehydrogenase (short-subunit alcohol dehydrogenase family)
MKRRTYLITGATAGMGLVAARHLARDGDAALIVGARSPERATALREAVPAARLHLLPLDTSSLRSVTTFCVAAEKVLGATGVIDGIACNAGLQIIGPHSLSVDGYDLTFATNHLGHFALVNRLLSRLAPGAAVVSTASGTHDPRERLARIFGFRGGLFRDAATVATGKLDPTASTVQQGMDRYATSKLCNILFTTEMARRVPASQARFIAFDPGLMPGTGLARDRSAMERWWWTNVLPALRLVSRGVSSAERSGEALARLLAEPALASSGQYVDFRLRSIEASPDARRADLAADLHQFSLRACATAA